MCLILQICRKLEGLSSWMHFSGGAGASAVTLNAFWDKNEVWDVQMKDTSAETSRNSSENMSDNQRGGSLLTRWKESELNKSSNQRAALSDAIRPFLLLLFFIQDDITPPTHDRLIQQPFCPLKPRTRVPSLSLIWLKKKTFVLKLDCHSLKGAATFRKWLPEQKPRQNWDKTVVFWRQQVTNWVWLKDNKPLHWHNFSEFTDVDPNELH